MRHTKLFYLYSYTDPNSNLIYYIGKGSNNRSHYHLRRAKGIPRKSDLPVVDKTRQLLSLGVDPIITIIELFSDEETAHSKEIFLIEKIGRKNLGNGPLLNLTNGGQGSSGYDRGIHGCDGCKRCQCGASCVTRLADRYSRIRRTMPPGIPR